MLSRIGGYIKKFVLAISMSSIRVIRVILNWLGKRNWSAGVILLLTAVLAFQSVYDTPNYPLSGYKIIPTKTYSYIDEPWIIYETDYTIKYSKFTYSKPYSKFFGPQSYSFSIKLPKSTSGYRAVMDTNEPRDLKIEWADASNGTAIISNTDKINPRLVRIIYLSEKEIDRKRLFEKPLLDIQNDSIMLDSFYLKVENRYDHDIKTLRLNSNVTRWIDRNLPELKNTSWTDQRVMIYDRGLPVYDSTIDARGIIIWDVNSIEPKEQKIYYFKKVKST
jgi:hypothetical protein